MKPRRPRKNKGLIFRKGEGLMSSRIHKYKLKEADKKTARGKIKEEEEE